MIYIYTNTTVIVMSTFKFSYFDFFFWSWFQKAASGNHFQPLIVTCTRNKAIAPNTFKCIQLTLLNVLSCDNAFFLCFRQLHFSNSYKPSETQEGSIVTRRNI